MILIGERGRAREREWGSDSADATINYLMGTSDSADATINCNREERREREREREKTSDATERTADATTNQRKGEREH
jgi:hypothetical protein